MRKVGLILVVLAAVAYIGYQYRLALLMAAVPLLADITAPIGPNQPINWSQGPAIAEIPPAERPPNIIVILADDMGFNDVSFFNGGAADATVMTPHIDSIAEQGVAFTNGYAGTAGS